jgi:hypothetical protein
MHRLSAAPAEQNKIKKTKKQKTKIPVQWTQIILRKLLIWV